ncbi:MAG: hypothetical protein HJJLKODD_02876 [Phycisphaerae bacterium]|nr:hypothetical protein [Phycisphaerae bacterium]
MSHQESLSADLDPTATPRLRPVDVQVDGQPDDPRYVLTDPLRISQAMVTLSPAALQIAAWMDGTRTLEQLQQLTRQELDYHVELSQLRNLVHQLDLALMLEGPTFENYYVELLTRYRSAPTRRMDNIEGLGLHPDHVAEGIGQMFSNLEPPPPATGRLRGLILPHLDYPRGLPCYQKAYSRLLLDPPPQRVVILGTNHCGRSLEAVSTIQAFETPLGISRVDAEFLTRLESTCGLSIRTYELDHQREHSIELQVLLLQHFLGADRFQLVPILCPDICGPTGSQPRQVSGIDLLHLAQALRELLEQDGLKTLVMASADFSHVGRFFGDETALHPEFLEQVRLADEQLLGAIINHNADDFQQRLIERQNHTRVCSSGSIFTLLNALPATTATLLAYHQAVTWEADNCVTCAAVAFEAST